MTTKDPNSIDITRMTLAVLFIGIHIAASFWILRPLSREGDDDEPGYLYYQR